MDLPNGKIREKTGGGSAGHNGIKSIDAAVGNEYKRIRIGIGHPRDFESKMDPADWVLGRFTDEQMIEIKNAIDEIKVVQWSVVSKESVLYVPDVHCLQSGSSIPLAGTKKHPL